MAGYYDNQVLSEIESRIDIVDLISEDIALNRKGNSYWGLCPFHQEKTPSFSVNREKQMFYCFGCHEGGNIYSYLMKRHGFSFTEAIEQLAQKAGIRIEKRSLSPRDDRRKQIYAINKAAMEYFRRCLEGAQGQEARAYFARRGLTQESIDTFQLGWAPENWSGLHDYLLKKGYANDLLKQSGLLRSNEEKTRYYDLFRGRVMFPIIMSNNDVCGFGGRGLGEELPKYINSPETELFSKRRNLYALAQSRGALREKNEAILVEGYMDCIKLYQHGVRNVVASLGTSFTREQAELLGRFVESVLIMYDGDEAGQRETMRAIEILRERKFRVQVVTLPDEQDPDDFIDRVGKEEFLNYIQNNKISYVDFKLKHFINENKGRPELQDKISIIKRLRPDILSSGSVIEQEEYIRLLARRLNIEEHVLRRELKRDNDIQIRNIPEEKRDNKEHVKFGIQEKILLALLSNDDHLEQVKQRIGLEFFTRSDYQEIIDLYTGLKNEGHDRAVIFPRRLSEAGLDGIYASLLLAGEGQAADKLFVDEFIGRVERRREEERWQRMFAEQSALAAGAGFKEILSFMLKIEASLSTAREGGKQ